MKMWYHGDCKQTLQWPCALEFQKKCWLDIAITTQQLEGWTPNYRCGLRKTFAFSNWSSTHGQGRSPFFLIQWSFLRCLVEKLSFICHIILPEVISSTDCMQRERW